MGPPQSRELSQPLDLDVTFKVATREEARQRVEQCWQPSRVKVFAKTLTLPLNPPLEWPIGPDLDIIAENLTEHEIGLKHDGDPVTYLKLRFESIHDICMWLRAFQRAKRPEWTTDTSVCCQCSRLFGFWRRRHHCRNCGACICSICSRDLATLPHLGYSRAQRVCSDCASHLRETAASWLKQRMAYSHIEPPSAQAPPRRASMPV